MNKNRHRLDIVRDMLSTMLIRVRKTKVMYQATLNYNTLEKYLKTLLKNGLIQYDGDSHYLITGKGKEFLQMYANYLERCGRIREEIDEVAMDRLLLEDMCFNDKRGNERTITIKDVSA